MKAFLTFIVFLSCATQSVGQSKMIIDKPFNGTTFYEGFSKPISSTKELPISIQDNLTQYLDKILGNMVDSIKFSHGQIIDLEGKFQKDTAANKYDWIVPKYDLNFLLKDNSIGIERYYLQIRLDQHGQVLDCNWPKQGHSEKTEFENRIDIETFAIRTAKLKGFNTTNYIVDFRYNNQVKKLCWMFMFPSNIDNHRQEYDVLEIPWTSLEIIREFTQVRSTVQ
jgi:hypothetical protein